MPASGVVLLLEDLHPDAEALLATAASVVHAPVPRGPLSVVAPGVDPGSVRAILTRGRGLIDPPLIDACPSLEVIARPGAGTDNLAVAHAAKRGIQTVHAPGVNARTVAEHTMALILGLVRGVVRTAAQVAAGEWDRRVEFAGQEIAGMTLGVVGFGTIGQRVARLAEAFGMDVLIAARPSVDDPRAVPLTDLLARADVVTLHVPLTDGTAGLIGRAELATMKPGAFLINVARGGVVDGTALRQALAANRLGGFAADVLDVEPPPADDPLLTDDRVVITPHVAALTTATYREMCMVAARNVVAILSGDAPDPSTVAR